MFLILVFCSIPLGLEVGKIADPGILTVSFISLLKMMSFLLSMLMLNFK